MVLESILVNHLVDDDDDDEVNENEVENQGRLNIEDVEGMKCLKDDDD